MHKEIFIINCNTLLHVSTLLGHLQGEISFTVTLGLHFTVERECAVGYVLRCFWRVHAPKNNAVHSQQHILTEL
jgi:hypothetical protein